MIETNELLAPQNEEEERIFAEQDLLFAIQHCIQRAMVSANVSQKDLAAKIGKSRASVSQFFSAEANPTVRSVACVTHALGIDLHVTWRPRDADHCFIAPAQPKMEAVPIGRVIHRPDVAEWREAVGSQGIGRRDERWRAPVATAGEGAAELAVK